MRYLLLAAAALSAAAAAAAPPAPAPPLPPAQLASTALCAAYGIPDLAPYRYALPVASPTGATTNATPIFLPYYASAPLASAAAATTAVLFLHGLAGDAQDYFCAGLRASAGRTPPVLVLAPWFGNESTRGAYWRAADGDGSASLFWSNSRWSTGGSNTAPPRAFSTSFDLLDALLRALPRSVALASVAGFSAGAQLSGRYAFATPLGSGGAAAPRVRFIVSDAGSYLYLSPQRPAPACSPLRDTGAQHACGAFAAPPPPACAGYDDYKYGLQALDYLNPYLAPLASNATALQQAVERFPARDVRLILGARDACNCNTAGYALPADGSCAPLGGSLRCAPDAHGGAGCCDTYPDSDSSNALDVTCAAMLQGSNRLQRGLNFASHLRALFPSAPPPRVATAAFGHNASGLFFSAAFQEAAYAL